MNNSGRVRTLGVDGIRGQLLLSTRVDPQCIVMLYLILKFTYWPGLSYRPFSFGLCLVCNGKTKQHRQIRCSGVLGRSSVPVFLVLVHAKIR